jgi:hypothetical protein
MLELTPRQRTWGQSAEASDSVRKPIHVEREGHVWAC